MRRKQTTPVKVNTFLLLFKIIALLSRSGTNIFSCLASERWCGVSKSSSSRGERIYAENIVSLYRGLMMYMSPIYGRGACNVCSGIFPKGYQNQLVMMIFRLSDRLNQEVVFFIKGEFMKKIIFFALLGVNLVIKTQAFAYESVATLISIQDGDTLSAVVRGEKNKIRLLN